MILDIIIMLSIWMDILFMFVPLLLNSVGLNDYNFLPWSAIGSVWLIIAIIIIRYRGAASKYWKLIDMPISGQIIDFYINKINVTPDVLYVTPIENLLKRKNGSKYYRDRKNKTAYFSGGHQIRFTKDGINHTLDINDVIFTDVMGEKGFKNIEELQDSIIEKMMLLKDKDKKYVLTGTDKPIDSVDIEKNTLHKALYNEYCKAYVLQLSDGETVSFYTYNEYQKALGTSTDMASTIDYISAREALRAAKIKKKAQGSWLMWVIIFGAIVALVVIVIYLAQSGQLPFLK